MLSWSADIPAKEMAPRTGLGAGNRYRKAGQEASPEPQREPHQAILVPVSWSGGNHDPSREPGATYRRVGANDD
jgi:hypothetical protein